MLQFSLNYNRTFLDKHNVQALFLYEQREDLDDYLQAYRQFAIDALDQINSGSDKNKNNAGVASELANASFVGRINYDSQANIYSNSLFAKMVPQNSTKTTVGDCSRLLPWDGS